MTHSIVQAATGNLSRSRIPVELGDRSYEVIIGCGLLGAIDQYRDLADAATAVIVSNTVVGPLYAETLYAALVSKYRRVLRLDLPDGEAHKSMATLESIFGFLLEHACDRKTVLVALGGGVVGDITGLAAAMYMRGIPFVQVPTTLLAQVDSSVGGKTAVNHPLGKNMIGAFHQPVRVVCDLTTLDTLPMREVRAGLAEIIKYGPIADLAFLHWLEANLGRILERDPAALAHAVGQSVRIKARIVAQDEREGDVRAILNFGHTFGHAIEAGLGYGQWLHGEAVGCGMVMAAQLSHALGLIGADFLQRLTRLIDKAGLPTVAPVLDAADNAGRYLDWMRVDKKAEAGAIKFVVIDEAGQAMVRKAPEAMVREVIVRCCTHVAGRA